MKVASHWLGVMSWKISCYLRASRHESCFYGRKSPCWVYACQIFGLSDISHAYRWESIRSVEHLRVKNYKVPIMILTPKISQDFFLSGEYFYFVGSLLSDFSKISESCYNASRWTITFLNGSVLYIKAPPKTHLKHFLNSLSAGPAKDFYWQSGIVDFQK